MDLVDILPTREDIRELFLTVERLFVLEFHSALAVGPLRHLTQHEQAELSFCCDENDEQNMITMANNIRQVPEFSSLGYRDIFTVLIFSYYSLRYNEQTEDWLTTGFLERHLRNKGLGYRLYIDITTQTIMLGGRDLSSAIRRYILEMNVGRGKQSRSGKSRDRKTRKRKTRNRKVRNRSRKPRDRKTRKRKARNRKATNALQNGSK